MITTILTAVGTLLSLIVAMVIEHGKGKARKEKADLERKKEAEALKNEFDEAMAQRDYASVSLLFDRAHGMR